MHPLVRIGLYSLPGAAIGSAMAGSRIAKARVAGAMISKRQATAHRLTGALVGGLTTAGAGLGAHAAARTLQGVGHLTGFAPHLGHGASAMRIGGTLGLLPGYVAGNAARHIIMTNKSRFANAARRAQAKIAKPRNYSEAGLKSAMTKKSQGYTAWFGR